MHKPSIFGVLILVYMLCQTAGLFDGLSTSRANSATPTASHANVTRLQAAQVPSTRGVALTTRGIFYSLVVVGDSIGAWIGLAFVRSSDRQAIKQMSTAGVDEALDKEISMYSERFRT